MSPQVTRFPVWIPAALGAICLGLGAGLIYRHQTATTEKVRNVGRITHFSNEWVRTSQKLHEQKVVNLSLERDLTTQVQEVQTLSNNLAAVSSEVVQTQASAKSAAESAQDQVHRLDTRIADLQGQRDGMTKKMDDLTGSIANLTSQIAATQSKLESSEADRELLSAELKRLQGEKSELERRFHNLALVREQVRKLRDELCINRRLDWIRRGLYGNLKGGELLEKGLASAASPQNNFNLDVELRKNESAKVLSPPH